VRGRLREIIEQIQSDSAKLKKINTKQGKGKNVTAGWEAIDAVGTLEKVGETPPFGDTAGGWTSGGTSMSKPQRDPTEAGWGSERGVGATSRSWSESNRTGGEPGPPVV
jgi:hypothetical protein